ncbi:MAG: hypothetical protein LBB51_02595, partial [Zoogloeaceae bacterium]|nr:hypothetical protein [Zoogloeaceae bacterium]
MSQIFPSENRQKARSALLPILASALFCIVLSQIFFGVLQWFTFEKNFVSISTAPYHLIAASLGDDVETNLRMGKTLDRFKAFSSLAAESLQNDDFAQSAGLLRRNGSVA